MPAYALLLAHDEHPGPSTEWPAEPGGSCDGWAEWFSSTPLLFSVLLGDARHLPELVPCSAYQDRQSLSALASPMEQVRARWQWLRSVIEPLPAKSPAHWPDSVKKQWQHIDHTISTSTRQWLLLDCATLCPHDFDEAEFTTFLQAQRELCRQWSCSGGELPESLQALKRAPQSHMGWWSDSVIARTEVIEQESEEDWPAWLADHYELRHHGAWDEATESYYVMPRRHPRTGLKPQSEAERDHWPVGMVTPYGRWLQRPLEGASMTFVSGEHLSVHYPETTPGEGAKSGIKDLNGIWLVSPSEGYRDAYAVTPQVMACRSPGQENMQELRSLPGLALLHEGLSSIDYNEEQDEFIRAEKGPYGNSCQLLLKADGQPLFDAGRYEHINDFSAKTELAVACVREPFVNEQGEQEHRILEGVIDIRGQEIIPCQFKTIERGFSSSPPKVFPGRKLLAITEKGEPRIFNTKGKLLAAPDIWCPPLNCSPKKNELLTFMGEGPEAELVMFSIQDFSITRTGETWEDYRNALRGMFKGLGGDTPETTTMTRAQLMEAEDEDWMRAMSRILCLNDESRAADLQQQWRDCVAAPDPDDMGWDEDDEIDPDVMHLPAGENALTLYWGHLLAIADQFARFDWKDAEGIAATHWLPGTDDWQWDTPADGVESGLEHMAEHLAGRQLALIKLATDDDSLRVTVVRSADAEDFMERLAQAHISAWNYSAN